MKRFSPHSHFSLRPIKRTRRKKSGGAILLCAPETPYRIWRLFPLLPKKTCLTAPAALFSPCTALRFLCEKEKGKGIPRRLAPSLFMRTRLYALTVPLVLRAVRAVPIHSCGIATLKTYSAALSRLCRGKALLFFLTGELSAGVPALPDRLATLYRRCYSLPIAITPIVLAKKERTVAGYHTVY